MTQATDAAALVALYDERTALTRAMARHPHPTGAMAQAVMDKSAELEAACEEFRRRYYPRRHKVIVGARTVMVVSATAPQHHDRLRPERGPVTHAAADQLAAHLRDRTPTNHGAPCDAFDPCEDCRIVRAVHAEVRHAARVPQQRRGQLS